MSKTIYDLKLHESITIQIKSLDDSYPIKWQVTRVPGGWFYQDTNPNRKTVSEFFVSYNNEFEKIIDKRICSCCSGKELISIVNRYDSECRVCNGKGYIEEFKEKM